MIIALFTISLAMAEPRSNLPVVAEHSTTVGLGLNFDGGLESDALSPTDTAISLRPRQAPRHLDRYEFYHRYDYGLTSRYRPTDEAGR